MNYTYGQAVEYLYKIPAFAGKNTFESTKEFMHELGAYENMKNVIHVAGTNGKGSVCSYVQSVLLKAGYKVGMFTSPHLVLINERIAINGKQIDNKTFAEGFSIVKEVVDKRVLEGKSHPAFFEFMFAIACIAFEKSNLDYIILETGLGGRLDATNIVNKPLITAITTIGLDHTQYLGNTIEEIALEKAGIIKEGITVVFDADNSAVTEIIREKSAMKNAKKIEIFEQNVKIIKNTIKRIDFLAKYGYDNICVSLNTSALYQVKNASIALGILQNLPINLTEDVVKKGLEASIWHGRMEWLDDDFLIDGAHNMAGVKQLVKSVSALNKKIILIFSAVNDKDYRQMIEKLCSGLDIVEVIIANLKVSRMENTKILRDIFNIHLDREIFIEKDSSLAVSLAKEHLEKYDDAIIVAAGSLYLVGEIMSAYKVD